MNERRLAAIILGDVVGYSRLMGIDEVATMTALKAHRNELILPALAAYRGRMVGSPGDAMLIEFGSAVDAVSCAVMIQRKIVSRNVEVPEERRLRFRLGINLGDIVIDGEEIYGDGVNVAARLETLCEPGGLCLSRSIEEQVRGKLPFPFEDGGEQQLKNISYPTRIFRLPAEFIATLPETALPASRKKAAAQPTRISTDTILNGTYKIEEMIGSGGMGEIFKGHEIHSGGLVAIKVIRLDMMHNETALALFQKEARVLKDIHHEAIVGYYSFSFDPGSQRHYLCMEFVDGIALSTMLKKGPLVFEAVWALCKRVASGLQLAHERGIVHRDVSPDNIIVPRGDVGRAKIIDFGIARAADIGGTIIGGGFAGKYNYVSPEQLGLAGSEVTAQSDIYSFGLVLAEACLGTPLDMGGTQAEVIEKRRAVPDLTGIDSRLRPLIERMLQPEPGNRPASMAEVANWSNDDAARSLLPRRSDDGSPASGRLPEPKVQASAKPSRHIERWIIGGTLGAALVWGAGLLVFQTWFAPPHAPPPVQIPTLPTDSKPQTTGTQPTTVPDGTPDRPPSKPETFPGPSASRPDASGPTPTDTQSGSDTRPSNPPNASDTAPTDKPDTPSIPPAGDDEGIPSSPTQPSGPERIINYIRSYEGGGCFFAQPVKITESSAAIDGFAQSKDALAGLDQAFTRTIGFSPDIVGVRVLSRQCAALDFMRHVRTDATAPTLFLKSARIGRDQSLAGQIHGQGGRSIALLQVRDDGTVFNMSTALKQDGDAWTFNLHVTRAAETGAVPQLLVVVTSLHPLEALDKGGDMPAEPFFRAMLDEAASKGDTLSANTKAFLYGG